MENGPGTRVKNYEGRGKTVAEPDADPGLPPGESKLDHRGHYHPSEWEMAVSLWV